MSEPRKACPPMETTLNIIGGKWKPLILYFLFKHDVMRFNEIQRAIPVATRRMITKHLRELEADGIVHREVYAEVPPRVEYSLTEIGRSLAPVMDVMLQWGADYLQNHTDMAIQTPDDMYEETSEAS